MDKMVDLAKYIGVDDSDFTVKLDFSDQITADQWAEGGPLVGIRYNKIDIGEQRRKRRNAISEYAGEIAYHAALRASNLNQQ